MMPMGELGQVQCTPSKGKLGQAQHSHFKVGDGKLQRGKTVEIIKIIGIALTALIIIILLKQYKPEFAIYISLLTGVLILLLVMDKLQGIIILLQSFAVSICKDSGEAAIASKIEIGSKIIIISMSIPIISSLLEMILKILPT